MPAFNRWNHEPDVAPQGEEFLASSSAFPGLYGEGETREEAIENFWQMVGFYLGWTGGAGRGRALGLGELKFSGQVLPNVRKVVYNVDIKRVMRSKLVLGIADGWLSTDGDIIYRAKDLKVGLFKQGTAPA